MIKKTDLLPHGLVVEVRKGINTLCQKKLSIKNILLLICAGIWIIVFQNMGLIPTCQRVFVTNEVDTYVRDGSIDIGNTVETYVKGGSINVENEVETYVTGGYRN